MTMSSILYRGSCSPFSAGVMFSKLCSPNQGTAFSFDIVIGCLKYGTIAVSRPNKLIVQKGQLG